MRLPIDLSRCEVPLDHYEGTIATSETENIDEIVHNIASELEGQGPGSQREERMALDDLVQQGRRVLPNERV